ncbi:MAG: hypothetical protein ACI88H_002775 [Cocleimonas sp.]|jgi:hypothetical protein
MKNKILIFFIFSLLAIEVRAQQIATCNVSNGPYQDQIYLFNNMQYNSARNQNPRFARRDPSGRAFVQLSSFNPQRMFFIDWNSSVIEVASFGWRQIGVCNFSNGMPLQNPYAQAFQPLSLGNGHVRGMPNRRIPKDYSNNSNSFSAPLYTTEQGARNCANGSYAHNGSIDREKFGDCMVNEMLGTKERALYNCAKKSNDDNTKLALCSLSALGGKNEKAAVSQIGSCYASHQDNYDMYPLCMAQQNMNEDAAILLSCVEKQSQQGDVTFYGTAACYGGSVIDLTPEQQIALECAAGTGGEPYSFATCAGGRLTARELSKCFTHGIGGQGCFGPNNDIVKALRGIGIDISREFGPNNTIVKNWNNAVNDIKNGPGKNNEVTKTLRNAANDLKNGPGKNNDIVKAVESVVPGFKW